MCQEALLDRCSKAKHRALAYSRALRRIRWVVQGGQRLYNVSASTSTAEQFPVKKHFSDNS